MAYAQICDAPAERPADLDTMLYHARYERLFPGEGGLDLAALLRALPRDLPLTVEVPTQKLAATVPARDRAARARAGLLKLLDELAASDARERRERRSPG
jgi:sugar phosphate isomerase/epimerase